MTFEVLQVPFSPPHIVSRSIFHIAAQRFHTEITPLPRNDHLFPVQPKFKKPEQLLCKKDGREKKTPHINICIYKDP